MRLRRSLSRCLAVAVATGAPAAGVAAAPAMAGTWAWGPAAYIRNVGPAPRWR
ncbi:hypothetical protein [Streptomyces sp. NPDC058294]|uniref:hypothetical protein n=1 Tax=Streptomyces sp. NPDC058294 TaxID=3346430 RepID=UPI0036E8E965